ncbi:MAG: PASTA domain-containing protein [Bacillota bacterium]
MKKILDTKLFRYLLIVIGAAALLIVIFNIVIMPWYVSGSEVSVPKVIGLNESDAKRILEEKDLEPVNGGERYDERFPRGTIIFQKPSAGAVVKENRRIFLFISSGVPLVKVPGLKGKNYRDAKLTLERMDLAIGDTHNVQSSAPKDIIIDQQYYEGTEVKKGTRVNVTLSAGENLGIKVPDLLGKSLSEAERILKEQKLNLGKINYQPSFSLLPNTVIDQYPSKDNVVSEGSSIDLFVTKNVTTPNEVNGE